MEEMETLSHKHSCFKTVTQTARCQQSGRERFSTCQGRERAQDSSEIHTDTVFSAFRLIATTLQRSWEYIVRPRDKMSLLTKSLGRLLPVGSASVPTRRRTNAMYYAGCRLLQLLLQLSALTQSG